MPRWFAIAAPGLEPIVQRELTALGVKGILEPGAIGFDATIEAGTALTWHARTPTRLLMTVAEGATVHTRQLGDLIRTADWEPFFRRDTNVTLHISTRDSKLRFKDRVQRTVTRALAAAQKRLPAGPSIDQRLHIRIVDDHTRLALDAGGTLLHRRGWRLDTGKAPIRENLAASLLIAAGYTGDEPLIDPFCGAGTIPIEAAMMSADSSPFRDRTMAWGAWQGLRDLPPDTPKTVCPEHPILGSDKAEIAITRAKANAERAGVALQWQVCDVAKLDAQGPAGLVVTNPPYGRRLGKSVEGVYRAFGRTLRAQFPDWRVIFLSPNRALAALVDRRAERLTTFSNGGSRVGIWVLGA